MNFTKKDFDLFRDDIKQAVETVEKKYGVEIKFGNIKYDNVSFTLETTVFNGSADDAKKIDFERRCELYGLSKDDFGKEITIDSKVYIISGIEAKRRKYPMLLKNKDTGDMHLFTESAVRKALGK